MNLSWYPLGNPNKLNHSHRMVWFGRDLKEDLLSTPCHGQEHCPLDHIAQSSIQLGHENFQGWDNHGFSWQPVPVSHHFHSKEFFSNN